MDFKCISYSMAVVRLIYSNSLQRLFGIFYKTNGAGLYFFKKALKSFDKLSTIFVVDTKKDTQFTFHKPHSKSFISLCIEE